MKCTALLMREHKTILRILEVVNALAKRAATSGEMDREDIDALLEILRVFADDLHQGKEEGALFPIFTASCDKTEIDSVRHMLFEHEQDRSLIEGMEQALRTSNSADFSHYAARLTQILGTHIQKEDNFLFAMVDRTLSDADDEKVVAGFEAFDRDFTERGLEKLLHRLRMLEWKYLSRAA